MSNSRLMLGIAVAVLCGVLGSGCGGDNSGGTNGGSGTGGGTGAPYGPDAGGRPIGAGQRGHEGKGARGGPIDVPPPNVASSYTVADAEAYFERRAAPHCAGRKPCLHYNVVGGEKCYGHHTPERVYPGGTVTIYTDHGLCELNGQSPDVSEEPEATPAPPESPPVDPNTDPPAPVSSAT